MSESEFSRAVSALARFQDEASFGLVIEAARKCVSTPGDVARLAEVLADSGERLGFPEYSVTADIPSTGGPSSLSTLLCPLYLVAYGAKVPKLGVPGRPAGGIDVLAQIPGYRVDLDNDAVKKVIAIASYAHFLAGPSFAPADLRLFRYRQKVGAQDVAALVVASTLSKKLAVGANHVGLDIRVYPEGNFGRTWDEARRHAKLFNATASALGIKSVCFLTDGALPYQERLGRRESLVALHSIFAGTESAALKAHHDECRQMASVAVCGVKLADIPIDQIKKVFLANLVAQGADELAFMRLVDETNRQYTQEIFIQSDGTLMYNLPEIRDLIMRYHGKFSTADTPFPDPCGVVFQRFPGDVVMCGDVVAKCRGDGLIIGDFFIELCKLFSTEGKQRKRRALEIVTDA